MNLTDKLDGIKIEATFSVKRDADASSVQGCNAVFTFDGITLKHALETWARKSLVIDLQRVARGLTEAEIRETFVKNTYTVHALNAGKKIASPAQQRAAARAALLAMTPEERAELLKDLD